MKVDYVTWRPTGGNGSNCVIRALPNTPESEMVIVIENWGSDEERFQVSGAFDTGHVAEALRIPLPADGWLPSSALGPVMIWVKPTTWAWVIHDMMRDQ